MQWAPQAENDRTTMQHSSIQPITDRILVALQDATGGAEEISFQQGAPGGLENQRVAFQTVVGRAIIQGYTAPTTLTKCLGLAMVRAILDHFAC